MTRRINNKPLAFCLLWLITCAHPAHSFSRNSLLFATRVRRRQHRRTYWDLVHPRAQPQQKPYLQRMVPSSTPPRKTPETTMDNNNDDSLSSQETKSSPSLLKRAVRIYADYAKRLWNETTPQVRRDISADKAAAAVRHVLQVLGSAEEFGNASSSYPPEKVQALRQACEDLLEEEGHVVVAKEAHATTHMMEDPSVIMKEQFVVDPTTTPPLSIQKVTPVADSVTTDKVPVTTEHPSSSDQTDDSSKALVAPITGLPMIPQQQSSALVESTPQQSSTSVKTPTTKKKKPRRSIWFGAVMGMAVACWVFSGNYIFTGIFTLMTVLGQLEYYRMVMNTGVYPARRISVVGAGSMFLTALFCPQHHQIILPLAGLYAMVWFLVAKRSVTTIPEIATTFTGMFYLGYVPSFWVRIRLIGAGREPTRLAPLLGPWMDKLHLSARTNLPNLVYPKAIHLPITTGAIFIFWTWLCLAFSDVGAYFVGKNLGRTKLGTVAPAAGATSPNKTVEGVLGGCAVSAALGMLGAWVQKWPYWALTGMVHGTLLGLIGLIGDLTASMIKRDAGIKDFGDLIPEHGGILDRVDSFVWSAPYSWLVCHTIIPALKNAFR